MKAVARASARVDLAGGTLDLWPLYLLHPGTVTVNFAVDLDAEAEAEDLPGRRVEITAEDLGRTIEAAAPEDMDDEDLPLLAGLARHLRPRGGVRIRTRSASPPGAGLGASSALAVAVTAALDRLEGRHRTPEETVRVTCDCETRALGFPAGTQDYWPAVLGGCLALHYGVGGCRAETLDADPSDVASRISLAYTGSPHHSGLNNWAVYKARLDGDPEVRERLDGVRTAATDLLEAIRAGDWEAAAAAMNEEWSHRRRLGSHVSTPRVEALLKASRSAGAMAGKVCGAGGGGCVALLCPPERREEVEAVFPSHGARAIEVRPGRPLRVCEG